MNHNNQIRSSRLYAETNQFAERLVSQQGRESSSKSRLLDFGDRIRALIAELPAKEQYPLNRLLEPPLDEIALSYQDTLKLDRLLRQWAEVVESERTHTSLQLKRVTNVVRPVIEQLRAQFIAQIHLAAEEERNSSARYIEMYRDSMTEFRDNHPEFAEAAEEALRNNPGRWISPLPTFHSDAEKQPFDINLELLLQPLKDAMDTELQAYKDLCNQRSRAAWQASVSLSELPEKSK
jgi:hypothetical protein